MCLVCFFLTWMDVGKKNKIQQYIMTTNPTFGNSAFSQPMFIILNLAVGGNLYDPFLFLFEK